MYSKTLTRPAVTLAVSALGLMLVAAPALSAPRNGAGARPQATQRHAPAGNYQRETVRQRTPDGHTSHTTWQNDRGQLATLDRQVVRDPAAGTRTANSQYHGPNGGTATGQTVTTRTEDGYTRNTTVTNGRGETATRDVVVTRDPEAGTRTRSVDATGFDGRTRSVDSTTTRRDNGFENSTTITGPNGNTRTREVTVIRDPVNHTVTTTVEHSGTPGPNGG